MERRKFLLGAGSASLGGSALLGTGAFSRVESQRGVSVQVAEDPDAYLGLDKCRYPDYEGDHVPNGSYVDIDDNGHLEILMNPDNPTIGDSPLGEGVNSNSRTWFDRVFQICNQGKESVCVWLGEKQGAKAERVTFYLDNDRGRPLEGSENGVALTPGACICVGIEVNTRDSDEYETDMPKAGDQLLEEVKILADVDAECPEPVIPENGEPEEPGDDENFGNAISWITFCNNGNIAMPNLNVTVINDDGEPLEVEWTSMEPVGEVIVKAGRNHYLFEVDGDTSGMVSTRLDDDDNPDDADEKTGTKEGQGSPFRFDEDEEDRCSPSPCIGEEGLKLEWSDDAFHPAGTQDSCPDKGGGSED